MQQMKSMEDCGAAVCNVCNPVCIKRSVHGVNEQFIYLVIY